MEKDKKPTGRKCSVCANEMVKQINSAINDGKSFRAISRQFSGDDSARDSVRRHTENCLKLEIQALIKEKKIDNAIDHYQEISEQLVFAKDLRLAARRYLSDPETGELVLFPRSDEITVIYQDYSDTTPKGEPKKKRDSLSTLLERARAANIKAVQTVIKHVDIRSFALDSIRTTDIVLDKIAKIQGLYAKENVPPPIQPTTEELARDLFQFLIERFNATKEEALVGVKLEFGEEMAVKLLEDSIN